MRRLQPGDSRSWLGGRATVRRGGTRIRDGRDMFLDCCWMFLWGGLAAMGGCRFAGIETEQDRTAFLHCGAFEPMTVTIVFVLKP